MSKFNKTATRAATGTGPIVTETTPSGLTHEGAPGYARDAKSELFLLAVTNMVSEDTFYETGRERDSRYVQLVRAVAVADPDWTGRFLGWLRSEANMRSASLVGALEAARALLAAGYVGGGWHPGAITRKPSGETLHPAAKITTRQVVASVLQRADEPGEALAYWTCHYGRAIPKPVKRGVADAVRRLYNEYALLKYDTNSKGFRFADVLDLTHPSPSASWQGDLFACALARRHNRDEPCRESLTMVSFNSWLRNVAKTEPEALLNDEALKRAGMTWEDALSLVGSKVDKRDLWTALIPSMGYMALLRNLRNFDEAGVSDEVAAVVAAKLSDPGQVAKSRQFPFRFLSAYRAAPSLRWGHALEKALTASLANVPELTGRTLVLVDRSGSMFDAISAKSGLNRADMAAVFGAALALRNPGTDLAEFGSTSALVPTKPGDSLLRVVQERFHNLGGTYTAAAMQRWYAKHDRVVVVTDEQAHDGNPGGVVPSMVPVYTWNLAGYRMGHGPGDTNRHTFGGLTDAAFRLIPLMEAGKSQSWPF